MDEAEIKRLVGLVVDRTMRLDFSWDWPGGVALYGVCRAWEAAGGTRWIEDGEARADDGRGKGEGKRSGRRKDANAANPAVTPQ